MPHSSPQAYFYTLLFNLISEKVVRRSIEEVEGGGGGVILGDTNAKVLAFVDDDVDLIDTDVQNIERMYLPFKETATRVGLEMSKSKTKKMILSKNKQWQNLTDNENVREFRYQGSMVTSRNEMERERYLLELQQEIGVFTAYNTC